MTALLIGRKDLSDILVYNLTKSIYANVKVISQYHPRGSDIQLTSALKGAAIPIAQGAISVYKEKGLYRKERFNIVVNCLFVVLLVITLIGSFFYRKKIKHFIIKKDIYRVIVFLFLTWICSSFVLYYVEHKLNENYSTLPLSLWSGLVTFIRFGSKEPFSPIGRIISVIMMILGAGGIAWFTGQVASIYVHKKLIGGRKMEKIKNHYVLVNWNEKGYGIIEQLHNADLPIKKPIIIIVNSIESISFPDKKEYEEVFIIKGNPSNEVTLGRANIDSAHSVIVLAKELNPHIADAESILIILAIRKLCLNKRVQQVPIIVEIMDPQKVYLAEHAGI